MHDDPRGREVPEPSLHQLETFLARGGTSEEAEAVRAWAGHAPDGASLADLVQAILRDDTSGVDPDAVLQALHARLRPSPAPASTSAATPAARIPISSPVPGAGFRRHHGSGAWRGWAGGAIAAATLVVAVLSFVWHERGERHVTPESAPVHTYATSVGQRATVTLSDGTRVTLAPATTLRVPSDFGRASRAVVLDGQGYFDVAHVTGAPFVVRAGRTTARVLGTAFDVRHYANDAAVQVVVTSGKVEMAPRTGHPTVLLTAGTMGRTTSDSTATATAVNDADYTAWRDGRLVFRDAPVAEVLKTVGRWYGIDARLADSSLGQGALTATFDFKSMTNAVTALEVLLDATATYDATTGKHPIVTLHARRGKANSRRAEPRAFRIPKEVGR
jgi:transmembrane sensor